MTGDSAYLRLNAGVIDPDEAPTGRIDNGLPYRGRTPLFMKHVKNYPA